MYLTQNVLLYSYNFAPTTHSINILKFRNAREYSDTHEFWPTVADWFKEAFISCARAVRIEEKMRMWRMQV